ncbi:VOC family protein [Dysgonomonas sp. ZJ709]|uniref:VOC family protein n=1 Tax=Dysgonomonas sp. ZJ709 TaxID=2709797 RepID=UPI0013EB1039|nr:VOC family protein [Dysgonomonas sp. ZJ709]
MKLDHAAIWTNNLEKLKEYYVQFFDAAPNNIYVNETTHFSSYFLSFESGARLEIMHRSDIPDNKNDIINLQYKGLIHLAFSVDSKDKVDAKAKQLAEAGYQILRGPRTSGDGYYEFETIDPENNRLEVIYK